MNRATQWRIFGTVAIVLFLLAAVHSALPKGSTWVAIGLIAMAVTMMWTGREHRLYKMLTVGVLSVATWLFFSVWPPTAPTTEWLSSRFALKAPRNNFDPELERLTATSGVVVCEGKAVKKAPLEYKFDPDTGCAVEPMTEARAKELKELEHKEKTSPTTPTVENSVPAKMQWCWSKPPGVKGYKPNLRATCLDVHIDTDTQSVLSFTVFHRNGGEMESSSFFLDRVSGKGHWKNNGDLGGTGGDWFEQPVAPGSGMRILGQLRDAGRDNAWIPFYITGSSASPQEHEEEPEEKREGQPGIPQTFQVRNSAA